MFSVIFAQDLIVVYAIRWQDGNLCRLTQEQLLLISSHFKQFLQDKLSTKENLVPTIVNFQKTIVPF